MKKSYIFFAVLILLCVAGRVYFLFNKPHSGTAGIRAKVSISAADLYAKYQNNETAANTLFLDKVLKVKGTVSSVSVKGSIVNIQLNASAPGGINCNLFPIDSTNRILPSTGRELTIKGRCTGFLMDVNLVDCVIEN
jgi:hypothetical protein